MRNYNLKYIKDPREPQKAKYFFYEIIRNIFAFIIAMLIFCVFFVAPIVIIEYSIFSNRPCGTQIVEEVNKKQEDSHFTEKLFLLFLLL